MLALAFASLALTVSVWAAIVARDAAHTAQAALRRAERRQP